MATSATTAEWLKTPDADSVPDPPLAAPAIDSRIEDSTLHVTVRGDWSHAAAVATVSESRPGSGIERIVVAIDADAKPTLRTLARLRTILAAAPKTELDLSALSADMRRMLELALRVSPNKARGPAPRAPLFERIGLAAIEHVSRQKKVLAFLGETLQGLVAFFTGRARYRRADFWLVLQDVSSRALPIVSLVAFLFGAVLAFIGSLQLRPFGAQIFVANLVASGLALEMGGLITAVVMAGRAGAAFAAQIGSMQVNEEVDALKTAGFSPTHFLVVPRVVALGLMTPLLTLYADALGILGGLLVGVSMLDLSAAAYWTQTLQYLEAEQFIKGLAKSFVFGVLIALSGCLRGMQCGRSAQAVGEATTSAVVTSVVAIVVADAIITILIFELDL